jgi:hypothetical protein
MRPASSHFKRSNRWTKDRVREYPTAIASRGDLRGRIAGRAPPQNRNSRALAAGVLHDEAGAGVPRQSKAAGSCGESAQRDQL